MGEAWSLSGLMTLSLSPLPLLHTPKPLLG